MEHLPPRSSPLVEIAPPNYLLLSRSSTSSSLPPQSPSHLHSQSLEPDLFQEEREQQFVNLLSQQTCEDVTSSTLESSLRSHRHRSHPYYHGSFADPKPLRSTSSLSDSLYRLRRPSRAGEADRRIGKHSSSRGGDCVSVQDQYVYIRDIYRTNFPELLCPTPEWVKSQAQILLRRFLTHEPYEKYRQKSNKSTKDAKWPNEREFAFFEAIIIYPPVGRRQFLTPKGLKGRNELIAMHIACNTGEKCQRKQVSSHIQVIKSKCNFDSVIFSYLRKPESERNPKDKVARERLKQIFRISHFEMTVSTNGSKVSLITSIQDKARAFLDDIEFEGNLSTNTYFCNLAQTIAPWSGTNDNANSYEVTPPSCQIMFIQATLDLPTGLPRGAELTVDFHITAGEMNRHILGARRKEIECITHFYKGTRLLEQIRRLVDYDPVDCSLRGVSLGSTFWAALIPKLVPKLRADAVWQTDSNGRASAEISGRERVSRELKALNAVQEIYIKDGRGLTGKRLLVLCWHFELAEKGRPGELYWRNVDFSKQKSDDSITEDDRTAGQDDSMVMSNGDYMVAKRMVPQTTQPFELDILDTPLLLGNNLSTSAFDHSPHSVMSPVRSAQMTADIGLVNATSGASMIGNDSKIYEENCPNDNAFSMREFADPFGDYSRFGRVQDDDTHLEIDFDNDDMNISLDIPEVFHTQQQPITRTLDQNDCGLDNCVETSGTTMATDAHVVAGDISAPFEKKLPQPLDLELDFDGNIIERVPQSHSFNADYLDLSISPILTMDDNGSTNLWPINSPFSGMTTAYNISSATEPVSPAFARSFGRLNDDLVIARQQRTNNMTSPVHPPSSRSLQNSNSPKNQLTAIDGRFMSSASPTQHENNEGDLNITSAHLLQAILGIRNGDDRQTTETSLSNMAGKCEFPDMKAKIEDSSDCVSGGLLEAKRKNQEELTPISFDPFGK